MRILCVTHADFETPGVITTWAAERGHDFTVKQPYSGDELPNADAFDFLIVMGGPQSATEWVKYSYLKNEIDLIRDALDNNKPIIGFCLGAQLIGEALGATALRSPNKEVGVYPVMLNEDGENDLLLQGLPQSFPVIHWHNDMPGLTKDAVLLGFSEGCPRQIIRYKPNVYGFQCHLEITLDGVKTMIKAVPEDLNPSKYTQTENELLNNDYQSINETMYKLLDRMVTL